MASTYSALKIELIGTGEQSGTWGTTTNNNLGNAALGEAITGSADVTFASGDVTVTLTDTNASQTARNLRLNLIGTTGGARSLILGSGCQIEKLYLINNTCADAVTVKNTGGTGIAVPAGKTMFVFNNGTNVIDVVTHLSSLTLGAALPVTSGGTGVTTSTGSTSAVLSASPTLTGTPLAPTAAPGTNTTQIATTAFVQNVAGALGTMSTQNANAVAITGGNINGTTIGGTTAAVGTFSTLNTANAAITGGTITGITDLAVADGGTGASSITANSVVLGNGTSALSGNLVAPSTSGNVLTSNGTTWTSAAATSIGVGQTWQNVTGSRALATTYTNSTGKPIQVSVSGFGSPSGGTFEFYINGILVSTNGTTSLASGSSYASFSLIIPNGNTYSCSVASGNSSLISWYELR
jgi:hypothetical protein